MNRRKEKLKCLCIGIVIFVGCLLICFALLVASYSMPINKMKMHVIESANTLEQEFNWPQWAIGYPFTQRDNYCDTVMIETAITYRPDRGLLENAMLNDSFRMGGTITLQVRDVASETVDITDSVSYGRYWHGYLVFLKPLLYFFNLQEIRILSSYIEIALLLCFILLIQRRVGSYHAFVFLVGILSLSPITIALTLSLKPVYYVTIISSVVLLTIRDDFWIYKYLFLINGMMVAFLDFFTYPLVALCIPLIVYMLTRDGTILQELRALIKQVILWGIGYAGMWASKWIIGSVITGQNIIKDAISYSQYRTAGDVEKTSITAIDTIIRNCKVFKSPVFLVIFITTGLIILLILIIKEKTREVSIHSVPIWIVAIFPFLWFSIIRNHSYIHYWFTYRNLTITIIAVLSGLIYGSKTSKAARIVDMY